MSIRWSSAWKGSNDRAKQRKYMNNAPLHIKRKFLSANLAKTLREKVGKSSAVVKKGDEVSVKRGGYKGVNGVVNQVSQKKGVILIDGIVRKKTDGTEVNVPVNPSNVQVISLNLEDPRRFKSVKTETTGKKGSAPKEKKAGIKKKDEKEKKPAKSSSEEKKAVKK